MHEAKPSRTALRVALRRAAHQVHDMHPLVLDDPLAVRILGPIHAEELKRTPASDRRPFSAALRAWMVARARFAEDVLAKAVREGSARQYLILGAGLDTFAFRNPYPDVRVFEVDHPATQAWKRERIREAEIESPSSMSFVPVDFESQSLAEQLEDSGFDRKKITVTSWLGVVPYLSLPAFRATINFLGRFAMGSRVVFDYSQPREVLPTMEQLMLDSLCERVARAGEPFRSFFTPEALASELARAGLSVVEDLGGKDLTERYFVGRQDGLALRGSGGRICRAEVIA